MLYLFTGDDSKNRHQKHETFLKSLPEDVEIFSINRNDFDKIHLESLYSGSNLFCKKSVVVFSNIFDFEQIKLFILDNLKKMSVSENTFLFLEGKLNKTILDAFKKAKAEIHIFELSKMQKEKFNNFLLANAFGLRDKLNLWIYFRQAVEKGVIMEELVGVLFWKIKDMILKNNFSKFSENELKILAAKLSYLLPKARKEGMDAESAFERFLLETF